MSNANSARRSELWSRRPPSRSAPVRSAGGFYRTAEAKGRAHGGVPLNSANDAVVAAVRLAYRVAESQIDRSARLANRLREAGDRAVGAQSERQAVDAVERLVMKTLMSGLAWWEASVAEGRCPVTRLAAAEYQMLGSMLGLTQPAPRKTQTRTSEEERERPEREPSRQTTARKAPTRLELEIVHKGSPRDRRPVLVQNWEIASDTALKTPVFFYSANDLEAEPLQAELVLSGRRGGARLFIDTPRKAARGLWRAAICDAEAIQLGFIEIVL